MRRSCSILVLASLCVWCSCYTYRTVRTWRQYSVPAEYAEAADADPVIAMRAGGGDSGKKLPRRAAITRYYALMPGISPLADVNNMAVRLALQGRWSEAEVLLLEVLRENALEAGAYNNLGVLYEKTGEFGKSLEMFRKACALAPGNRRFAKNFETRLEAPRREAGLKKQAVEPTIGPDIPVEPEKPGNTGEPANTEDMEDDDLLQ